MPKSKKKTCRKKGSTCNPLMPGSVCERFAPAAVWCQDSLLTSILEPFWRPSSPLYSFLGARVRQRGSKRRWKKKTKKHSFEEMQVWGGACKYGEGLALEKHQPPSTQDQDQDRDPGLSLRTEANQRTTQRHSPRFRASAVADMFI